MSKPARQQVAVFPSSREIQHLKLKDKALRFLEYLKSQGISSELKVGNSDIFEQEGIGDTYGVFFRKKGWGGLFTNM